MYEYHQSYMLNVSMSAVGVVVKARVRRGALVFGVSTAQHTRKLYVFILI